MSERIPDLTFDILGDGSINLEQNAGCGETVIIGLHPCQLRLLAERAGLLNSSQTMPAGIERRLSRIRDKAADLADFLGSIPSFPVSPGMDRDQEMAHALWEAIDDLLSDYGMADDDRASDPDQAEPEAADQ